MNKFEYDYAQLVSQVLTKGDVRKGRNGTTKAIFGTTLDVDMSRGDFFPLLVGRKMYPKGILGELAAMLRGPKSIADFEKWGCNYWKKWGEPDGSINVDYGNAWFDFNGVNQFETLINTLKHNPMDRRLLITSWRPDNLDTLSLPCCHHTYQWFVREGKYLDMLWMQRSVDTMVGLPSDIILAAVWNILIANEVGLKPGKITFSMGDTHIYEEHFEQAKEYADETRWGDGFLVHPTYSLEMAPGEDTRTFEPDMLVINDYNPLKVMKFLLKA